MRTIAQYQDLVTSRQDVVEGFRWQAQEKARRANEFHAVAMHFIGLSGDINHINDIATDPLLYQFALGASALSAKAARQLGGDICQQIIEATIDFERLCDATYTSELERQYLITCGDALGGSMRNVIGQRAQNKLSDFVCQYLDLRLIQKIVKRNGNGKITEIGWDNRILVFDRKPKFIGKNIDFIMLDARSFSTATLEQPEKILACGELKGGIDPAGADEHWKTARAALDRVTSAFAEKRKAPPGLFFVGAAIEQSMAKEIHNLLASGALAAAANLHHEGQLAEFTQILLDL